MGDDDFDPCEGGHRATHVVYEDADGYTWRCDDCGAEGWEDEAPCIS